MGTGYHGGFGNTKGNSHYKNFTPVNYEGTVKVLGNYVDVSRKVYQRLDINFDYYDDSTGMINLERMKRGRPPIGKDGKAIQLHHVIQKESGPVVEIRETTHQEYYHTLHGLIGKGNSFRNDVFLSKQYKNFRSAYWKWRAKQYEEG